MEARTKLGLVILLIVGFIFMILTISVMSYNWTGHKAPVVKTVVLGRYRMSDQKNASRYDIKYFMIRAQVEETAGTWPFVDERIIKTDTILMKHSCAND